MDYPQEISSEERIPGELTPTNTLCNKHIRGEKTLCPTHPFSRVVACKKATYTSSSQRGWLLQTDEA